VKAILGRNNKKMGGIDKGGERCPRTRRMTVETKALESVPSMEALMMSRC